MASGSVILLLSSSGSFVRGRSCSICPSNEMTRRPKMMISSLRYGKQLQRRRQLRAELPESVWKPGEDHRDEELKVGEEEEEEELMEMEEAAITAGRDDGREPDDYDRRARIFQQSARLVQARKGPPPPREQL
ncbi:uncharacterized protein LOC122006573 [Zingiber officinale]|uniref:uncharacterized protein LOC122006573 n=1 Tax=Zingiber officinale TaxID=94328 RepID=UPI001C4B0083|nr:uncharacterized protein LOC122006573 [Zingiber officinale]